MSLSILLGASQPWLLGAVACTVTLLIVALLMLRRGQLRKQAQPEVEKVSTPPQVDPPSEEVKEEEFSTDSESETEPVTIYCNNGCQGACACPALGYHMNNSEPILSPPSPSIPSPRDIPLPEPPLPEVSKSESQSNVRKSSLDKGRLTFQYLKDKLHGNRQSFDAGENVNGRESPKSERRKSRFGWRRSLTGSNKQVNKSEQGSSGQVSQTSSQQKTESLKLLRGMLSFKKTASIGEVIKGPPVDPTMA